MSSTNIAHSYESIGIITIPVVSFRKDRIVIKAYPKDVFYLSEYDPNDPARCEIPNLNVGRTVFDVRVVNIRGKVIFNMQIKVKEVFTYNYNPNTDELEMDFAYTKIADSVSTDELPRIEPILAHIFEPIDKFLVLYLEGSEEACANAIKEQYQVFVHNGTVYYQYHGFKVSMNYFVIPDKTVYTHVASIVYAYAEPVVPSEEDRKLVDHFASIHTKMLYR